MIFVSIYTDYIVKNQNIVIYTPKNRWYKYPFIFLPGNYVLTYLYNQPKLTQFVVQGLVTLFARITKLGWFDSKEEEFVFRDVIQDVTKFLQVFKQLNP